MVSGQLTQKPTHPKQKIGHLNQIFGLLTQVLSQLTHPNFWTTHPNVSIKFKIRDKVEIKMSIFKETFALDERHSSEETSKALFARH